MALNITYTGVVVDENETPIDCNYQILYVRQNIWSPVHRTEYTQYNFNAGTASHLGQDGELKQNDTVIMAFFTSATRDTAVTLKFAAIANIHDGNTTTYLQDVQLKEQVQPECGFGVQIGTINTDLIVNANRNLDHEYFYKTKKHYQKESLYSKLVFPNFGVIKTEYDFGNGYDLIDRYIFNNIGDYNIKYKIYLRNSEVLECQRTVRIKYNSPIPEIIYEPSVIVVGSEINVISRTKDIDSRITNIKHMYKGDLESSNSNIQYTYTKLLDSLDAIALCQNITWNDGFEDLVIDYCINVSMQNQPPLLNLELTQGENIIELVSNAFDPEDSLLKVQYKIYLCKDTVFNENKDEDTQCTWILLETFESDSLSDFDLQLQFYRSGDYKITAQAFDTGGLKSEIQEKFFSIKCNAEGAGVCDIVNMDWAKKINKRKFKISSSNYKFGTTKSQVKFKFASNKLIFKQKVHKMKFNLKTNNIKFKLMCKK